MRQAILDSNTSVGVQDTIVFQIGTGVQTIAPLSVLPTITDPVVIDGTTQDGFAGTPLIVLNGSNASGSTDGLVITAGNSTVRGLVINGFGGQGIEIRTKGNNLIAGNYIGTDVTGSSAVRYGQPNGSGHGIYILGSSNNTIGGITTADRNVISGNSGAGVLISGVGSTGNTVAGNYIGTNADGSGAVGNYDYGVLLDGVETDNNRIGGTAAGAGNLISGNNDYGGGIGILSTTASGNVIQGNLIGTDATGSQQLGNVFGVSIAGPNNTLGGPVIGARNIIVGARGSGVEIGGNATGTLIQDNFIGTDITGTADLGVGGVGIGIHVSDVLVIGNRIHDSSSVGVYISSGSRTLLEDNIIDGNGSHGIYVRSGEGQVNDTTIRENVIRENQDNGILVLGEDGEANNTVIRNNLISANWTVGVKISGYNGSADGTIIQGNLIGTDATGTQRDGNKLHGIYINNANHTLIGGPNASDRNIISGNAESGVIINGVEQPAQYNVIQGNFIGVDITGTQPLGNGYGYYAPGIVGPAVLIMQNSQFNTVTGNVISSNYGHGLMIGGNASTGKTTGNVATGNFIGTDLSGTLDLGNAFSGVVLYSGGANNTIGGPEASDGNTIAFNRGNGILAGGNTAYDLPGTGNAFLSNRIYGNGFGIDVGMDFGVTPNDVFGHDGPNSYQNYPELTAATAHPSGLTVRGSLSAAPNTQYLIQFFGSDTADETGFGQGQRLLGSITVTTDGAGMVHFVTLLSGGGYSLGDVVSAIATDTAGNSSEFSQVIAVVAGSDPSNQPPVVTVPPIGPTVEEEGTVAVGGISISDADAGTDQITVTITVPAAAGTISATDGGGNAGVIGSGTPTLTIRGQLDAVNLALGTLSFTGAVDFTGTAGLWIEASDNESTATGAVTITVTPVVPPPVVPPFVADLGVRGLWHYDTSGKWAQLSKANVQSASVSADGQAVVADFGTGGIRRWTEASGWVKISPANAERVIVSADGSTVVADRGTAGLWRWTEAAGWTRLSPANAESVSVSGDGRIIIADMGKLGLRRWSDTDGWITMRYVNAEQVKVSSDGRVVVADLGKAGLWWTAHPTGGWIRLTPANVENVQVAADGETLLIDFGPGGLKRWTLGGKWTTLTPANVERVLFSDDGETVVADFGAGGLKRWALGDGWQQLTPSNVQNVVMSRDGAFVIADIGRPRRPVEQQQSLEATHRPRRRANLDGLSLGRCWNVIASVRLVAGRDFEFESCVRFETLGPVVGAG